MFYLLANETNYDLLVSIVAIFVAVGSMVVAIIFGVLQKNHNKNSLRPFAFIKLGNYESCIYVELKNVGTGPMIIKDLVCKNSSKYSKILIELMPCVAQYWDTFLDESVNGYVVPANDKLVLLKIRPKNENIRKDIRCALSQIKIKINYTDIYNTDFFYERSLEYYKKSL